MSKTKNAQLVERALTIRIDENLLEAMRALAVAHNRSLNSEVLTALQDYERTNNRPATIKK